MIDVLILDGAVNGRLESGNSRLAVWTPEYVSRTGSDVSRVNSTPATTVCCRNPVLKRIVASAWLSSSVSVLVTAISLRLTLMLPSGVPPVTPG